MEGGIRAWEGLTAEGPPESGMAFFPDTAGTEELIGLAWVLEEGSRRFYAELTEVVGDGEGKAVFSGLSIAEEQHKATLMDLMREIAGEETVADIPGSIAASGEAGDIMEGGMRISQALRWIQDKPLERILELSISLEANAYDLYIKMTRRFEDEKSRKVFATLVDEEKQHLGKLASLLERKI
ncbi:MAG: ferritin family protein [Nitrospirota bacterium]